MMEMIGPKPRWEYRKIALLNELNGDIAEEAQKNGWHLTDTYTVKMPDLDRDCDPMNVHGWIQNMLDLMEGNLAGITEEILRQHPEAMDVLKETAYRFGYRYAKDVTDAQNAYQLLDDVLLNGMPCDDVNEVTQQSADQVSWYEKQDMHSRYWKNGENYRKLRNEVIRGLLSRSSVTYAYGDGNQSLTADKASL